MIDFSHTSYLRLLSYLKEKNYFVGSFSEFPDNGPAVILRHDIDFSIIKALEMARLDSAAGVHSTFFVLTTSPYYNAYAEESLLGLKEIIKLGHEIGLHYDCSLFVGMNEEQMNLRVSQIAQSLGESLDIQILSVAQHKPSLSDIRPTLTQFRNAYGKGYFKEIAYLSDSRMSFGADDVFSFFDKNPRSQLLIHPIWWNKTSLTYQEVYANLELEIDKKMALTIQEEIRQMLIVVPRLRNK